jgi:circadian clock protein KaiC
VLYITLSETEEELRGSATVAWLGSGRGRHLRAGAARKPARRTAAAEPALFLGPRTRRDHPDDLRGGGSRTPKRVVIDSLSEIRLLAQSSLRYRRQVLALKHYFAKHGATVLLLDDLTTDVNDKTVHSVAHGVIQLQELAPEYGAERRRCGSSNIAAGVPRRLSRLHHQDRWAGGLSAHRRPNTGPPSPALSVSSGVAAGRPAGRRVERGSSALILGPAGTGKSLLHDQFRVGAVARREGGPVHLRRGTGPALRPHASRSASISRRWSKRAQLIIEQVDAAELSPGEFASRVRTASNSIQTVVIDSLNGYQARCRRSSSSSCTSTNCSSI